MRKKVILGITDPELQVLILPKKAKLFPKIPLHEALRKIPLPAGVVEQGTLKNEALLVELVKGFFKEDLALGKIDLYLALPFQLGVVRNFSLPWIKPRERKEAIRYLVEEEVPFLGSDLIYDYLVLEENRNEKLSVLVGAARRSVVQHYINCLERLGFHVRGADFTHLVLGQALNLPIDSYCTYINAQDHSWQMAYFHGPLPQNVRTLTETSGDSGLLEDCPDEVTRTFLYYNNLTPEIRHNPVLIHGNKQSLAIAQKLLKEGLVSSVKNLSIPSLPENWFHLEENMIDPGIVCYGLRVVNRKKGLNIWPKKHGAKHRKELFIAAALLGSILLGGILAWLPLLNQETQLKKEVSLLKTAKVYPVQQTNKENALPSRWQAAQDRPIKVGQSLEKLQDANVEGIILTQIEYKQGGLYLKGSAENADGIMQIMEALRAFGWENPVLSAYHQDENKAVEFSLNAKYNHEKGEAEKQ